MASYPMNKKRKNFSKLSRAIIDLCTDTLRVTLDSHTKPQAIDNKLGNIPNKPKLNARETSMIKDASKVGSYKDFDITLLYYILRCVCNQDIRNYLSTQINPSQLQNNSAFMADLTQDELKKVQQITNTGLYGGCNDDLLHKLYMHFRHSQSQMIHPSKGWGKIPDANDTELGDNIERIREIRNSVYAHIPSTEVSDTKFESHWNQLIVIMSGMNTHFQSSRGRRDFKNDLDQIKSSSMDEEMEQDYIDEIKRLAKYEEDLAKRMDEVEIAINDLGEKRKEDNKKIEALSEKRKEDNKKIEALSEKTERLAIDANTNHDQIKSQLANVVEEVMQLRDGQHKTESKQMKLQVGQKKLEDGVDGLRNQISNLDTKVQKTVETTTDLKGALETVQEDVATLKEHAEGRRERSKRRKMTATEQVTAERISRIVNSGIFHTTTAIKKGKDILKENGLVIFTGQPGQGKTDGAFYLLHLFQQEHPDWIFVHYTNLDIQQWRESLDENTKTVMLLDDILGRTNTDENVKSRGEYYWRDIFSMIKSGKLKVILTFRKFIFERNMSELEKYDLFSTNNIIDLSTPEYQLTNKEKEQILKKHLKANNIQIGNSPFYSNFEQAEKLDKDIKLNIYDIKNILQTNPFLGFPLSCFLFCSCKKYTKQRAKFFERPNEILKHEINSMVSLDSKPIEKIQYLLMSYMMLNGGEIDLKTLDMKILDQVVHSISLKRPSKRDIDEAIIGIKDEYIVEMNKKYVFKHQTILESVALCFCKDNVALVLEVCEKRFISEFIRPQNFDAPKGEVVVLLDKNDYMHLTRRIKYSLQYDEIQGDKTTSQGRWDWYGWWSTHDLMDDKEFVDLFIEEIQSDKKMKSGVEKCLNVGLFSNACMLGKPHLIDRLYNMFRAQISGLDTSKCLEDASSYGHTSTVIWLMDNNIGISNIIQALKYSPKSETSTAIIGHRKFTTDHMKEFLISTSYWFLKKLDKKTISALLNRFPDIEHKYLLKLLAHKDFDNPFLFDTLFSRRPDFIMPSFLLSCLSGRKGIAKLMLSKHPDEIKEQHIQVGIVLACFKGYFTVVDVLLKSIKAHLIMQQTLKMGFSFACAGGNKDFLEILYQNRTCDDIYQKENDENLTNVHIASFFGRSHVFETLVGWGLNVTDVSKSSRSSLGYAMLGYRYTGMNGNDVASAIKNESNFLWQLCNNPVWSFETIRKIHRIPPRLSKFGTVSEFTVILQYLIKHKDVVLTDLSMALDEKNCTLGHYCVVYDNLSVIESICEVNPSALSCQNTNGHKPIHLAALMGRHRIFKTLLSICSKSDGTKVPNTDTAVHQLIVLGKKYARKQVLSKDNLIKRDFLNFLPDGHTFIRFDKAYCYKSIEEELTLKSGSGI